MGSCRSPPPPMPELAPERVATASFPLRYEDIAQDGRMMATALAAGDRLDGVAPLLKDHPAAQRAATARASCRSCRGSPSTGTDEPLRVDQPVDRAGGYQLAHAATPAGADRPAVPEHVGRGPRRARPGGARPRARGRRWWRAGVFAEHTFTRLFAPPDQRKVTRLDVDGRAGRCRARTTTSRRPTPRWSCRTSAERARRRLPAPTSAVTVFGLEHTDSNQHVNSLVYPRLFAEAALRRLDGLGRPGCALVRSLDIAYRKPSFAGDKVRIHLRMFTVGERVGAAGFLVAEGEPRDRPRVLRPHPAGMTLRAGQIWIDRGGTFTDGVGARARRAAGPHRQGAVARRAPGAPRSTRSARCCGWRTDDAGAAAATCAWAPRWRPTRCSSGAARRPRWRSPAASPTCCAIGDQTRPDLFALDIVKPAAAVPRGDRGRRPGRARRHRAGVARRRR